jgi:hypothetical protein
LTWPGWVTFSVPFRREMISKKTSGTATRDLGFVVTTSTRHRWQVLPSVEWLSDTFSKACRPVFPKKTMKFIRQVLDTEHPKSLCLKRVENYDQKSTMRNWSCHHSFPGPSDTPWQGITKCIEPWRLGPVGK